MWEVLVTPLENQNIFFRCPVLRGTDYVLKVKQNSHHLKSSFASHSQFHLKKKKCWWEEPACHSSDYSSGTDWISPFFIQIAFRPLLLESH